jgi:2-keto-4-pentenoate hydratase/2-oxohepta-3-ene-1,7-dioic acid hydratase in catechol pathway
MGHSAKNISEDEALDCVAGYCTLNDVSERSYQLEGTGQWLKGKSHDTFGPIGPWLVTRDEVPDPQNLKLWLDVNGERCQNGSTSTMVFTVAHVIAYISRFMTLRPGDIIATGTPPGVGMGFKPPRYLKPGDKVSLEVEGLGPQIHKVAATR